MKNEGREQHRTLVHRAGTGVVSLVLLTIVVALGIASRSGRTAFGLPRFAVALVHRNAALLAVVTLVIHITTLLLDTYAKVHITDLLVPFVGSYRPFWQGLGTVGAGADPRSRRHRPAAHRMPERVWRAVHWLAYLCWPVAFAHGLGNGTDSGTVWMRAIAGCCALSSRPPSDGGLPRTSRTQQCAPAAHPALRRRALGRTR